MSAQAPTSSANAVFEERVLIVDDDAMFLRSAVRVLEMAGFKNVRTATEPCGAEELLDSHRPRAVLIDLDLGEDERSGFFVLQHVKRLQSRALPIVLSGHSSPMDLFRAARAGAVDFLVKTPALDLPRELARILENERGVLAVSLRDLPYPPVESSLEFLRAFGLSPEELLRIEVLVRSDRARCDDGAYAPQARDKELARLCSKLGVDDLRHLVRVLSICEIYRQAGVESRAR